MKYINIFITEIWNNKFYKIYMIKIYFYTKQPVDSSKFRIKQI